MTQREDWCGEFNPTKLFEDGEKAQKSLAEALEQQTKFTPS